MNRLTSWINSNKDNIVGFFEDVGDRISGWFEKLKSGDIKGILKDIFMGTEGQKGASGGTGDKGGDKGILGMLGISPETIASISKVAEDITGALDTIKGWVDENGPLIKDFFSTLGEIVATVFEKLTGKEVGGEGGLEGMLSGVTTFMQYVVDNKDSIAEFATDIMKVVIALQIFGFIITLVSGLLAPFLPIIMAVAGALGILSVIIGIATSPLFLMTVVVALLIGLFVGLMVTAALVGAGVAMALKIMQQKFEEFKVAAAVAIATFIADAAAKFEEFKTNAATAVEEAVKAISGRIGDWTQAGKDMIQGMVDGVLSKAGELVSAVVSAISAAIAAAKKELLETSPSKIFMDIGGNTMKGMAIGIQKLSGMVAGTMENAMAQVAMPALTMPQMAMSYAVAAPAASNTYATTNNYNPTVHSGARVEPIVQDYEMMRSQIGAG
jgi:hypothetical protein